MSRSLEDLAELCESVGSVSGRKRKVNLLADFLKALDREEVGPSIMLLLGRPLPETSSSKLDVGYTMVEKVREGKQSTLFDEPIMITDVMPILQRMAEASGPGSRRIKEDLLRNLFGRLSPRGGEFLRRSLYGEMRIGASEGVILEAIAEASGHDIEEVRSANMLLGDVGRLAEMALDGEDISVGARLFVPIRPMLAESVQSIGEALDIMGKAALEFKLDGMRVQVHREGDEVRFYSRRLTEVTESIPELVDEIRQLPSRRFVAEGEVVAFKDKPLPFQDLMRRMRRVKGIEEASKIVPLRLFLFDLLVSEEGEMMGLTYRERFDMLKRMVPDEMLVPRMITSDVERGEEFLRRSLEEGHEGIMAKDLDGPYTMGKRGRKWLKIKRSHTLDLVIVAAEWGHGRRRGWLSDYYLAAIDGEGYTIVGKTFKGLTDEEFKWMTDRLLELRSEEEDRVVRVLPRVVVEVAFDDVQTSPRYPSGMALRFARIKAIREDKDPSEADHLESVRRLHEAQFETKGRIERDC